MSFNYNDRVEMPNGSVGRVVSIVESKELFGDVTYMVRDMNDDHGPFKKDELSLSDKPLKKYQPKQFDWGEVDKALGTGKKEEKWDTKTTTYQMPTVTCRHHLDPLPLPDGKKLYLSASRDARGDKSKGAKDPTSGVYLDPVAINHRYELLDQHGDAGRWLEVPCDIRPVA